MALAPVSGALACSATLPVVGCFSFSGEVLLVVAGLGLLALEVDFLPVARVTGVISLTTRAGLGEDLKEEMARNP